MQIAIIFSVGFANVVGVLLFQYMQHIMNLASIAECLPEYLAESGRDTLISRNGLTPNPYPLTTLPGTPACCTDSTTEG